MRRWRQNSKQLLPGAAKVSIRPFTPLRHQKRSIGPEVQRCDLQNGCGGLILTASHLSWGSGKSFVTPPHTDPQPASPRKVAARKRKDGKGYAGGMIIVSHPFQRLVLPTSIPMLVCQLFPSLDSWCASPFPQNPPGAVCLLPAPVPQRRYRGSLSFPHPPPRESSSPPTNCGFSPGHVIKGLFGQTHNGLCCQLFAFASGDRLAVECNWCSPFLNWYTKG
jgi:hypothetical protein